MRSPKKREILKFILFTRWPSRVAILSLSFCATVFGILGPFFQKEFVDTLTGQSPLMKSYFPESALWNNPVPLLFLFLSFASLFLFLFFSTSANYLGGRESILMQQLLGQKLYHHILRLRSDSLKGRPIGDFVSVYATDIPGATVLLDQSLPLGAGILFPLILAPLALVYLFELPLTLTLTILGALVLLNLAMAFRQSRFFFFFKKLAADRIGLVNEWIQNIRTLRILGWVTEFEDRIFEVRQVETLNRVRMVTNGQVMNSISSSVTFFLNILAVVGVLYLTQTPLSSGTLLALLWLIGFFLTRPFRQLPWFFTFIFDAYTSLKRLSAVFELENSKVAFGSEQFAKLQSPSASKTSLKIKNLSLKIEGVALLKNLSFEVFTGEFVCIVGEVGSGKSLLLLSLMGETGAEFDDYEIGTHSVKDLHINQVKQYFTFVPQEGFIMSASLRENVAFQYDADQTLDEKILSSLSRSQFDLNSERTHLGLDTEIGERGVNLSGGQKQRVSLARVDFLSSEIVLMDDCLSALDVDTEEKIMASLIDGAWAGKTRLLVTHRLSVLSKADRIFFMQSGEIIEIGTFNELLMRSESFRKFTLTVTEKAPEPNAPVHPLQTDFAAHSLEGANDES